MLFKEPDIREQIWSLKPRLQAILFDFAYYSWYKWAVEITITSAIRLDNPDSVHYYGRGVDIRSWVFTPEQRAELAFYINNKYKYGDDQHETLLYHKTNSDDAEFHFHLQVRDESPKRGLC